MVAFCDDEDVIGSDFYVMERLDGTILRRDLPDGLELSPDDARTLCTRFLDVLVELHSVDPADGRAGRPRQGRRATSRGRSAAGPTASARRAPTTSATTSG